MQQSWQISSNWRLNICLDHSHLVKRLKSLSLMRCKNSIVRYAKATCLSMNTKALNSCFRLKRNCKKLDSYEYVTCLKRYLDTNKSVGQLTIPDLNNTLLELQKNMFVETTPIAPTSVTDVSTGAHAIVFWIVKDTPEWSLAIGDRVHDDGIDVLDLDSNLRKKKTEWAYPRNSKVYTVDFDQVIQRQVTVGYLPTERIRYTIQPDMVNEIDAVLAKLTIP